MTISELNQKFGIPGTLEFFEGNGSLSCVRITNSLASCVMSLYGAHVFSYKPAGQEDLLWMSETTAYEEGKAIRGGIPVCFPWFGPHAEDASKPQHGFARLMNWDVEHVSELSDGSTELVLTLNANDQSKALWPYDFEAELVVVVGKSFSISLQIKNTDEKAFTYTDALHTYFHISDVQNIAITGLSNTAYYNGFAADTTVQQDETLLISKEENRRYIQHKADCVISDSGFNRTIHVSKTGSNVTVVWNPYQETAKNIGDMPDDGYKTFICVEAVNAYSDAVTLEPGSEHIISQTFFAS